MIRKIALLLVMTFPVLLWGQEGNEEVYWSGDCMLSFDHAKAKDFQKFSKLPKHIRLKLDSIIHIQYQSFAKHMSFKGARLFNSSEFKDSSEEFERGMYIEVLYSLKIPGKIDKVYDRMQLDDPDYLHINHVSLDGTRIQEHCIYFTFDSLGNRILPELMPDEKWLSKGLLSPKQAKNVATEQWKLTGILSTKKAEKAKFKRPGRSKNGDIDHLDLKFYQVEKCFVWVAELNRHVLVINAHSGEIMRSYERRLLRGF